MEEKKEVVVVKEKKDVKKSKGWGRRSTRAKKYISYRYVSLLTHYYLMLFKHSHYSLFIVTFLSDLMSLMKRSKRQSRKTLKRQKVEVEEHFHTSH